MSIVSNRTVLRDAVVSVLESMNTSQSGRVKDFDVSLSFLNVEDCKRFPTYCVVVTDETPELQTLQQHDCRIEVVIVIYAKDDRDVRAKLDASIEDVYEAMLRVQALARDPFWKLRLDSLTTDEGTAIAKPHAQCLQRWIAHHHRATVAA